MRAESVFNTSPSPDQWLHSPATTHKSIAYFTRFGETVPKELCRWVLSTHQTEQLEQMLSEQIRRGEAVDDWHAFARPLVEPLLGVY